MEAYINNAARRGTFPRNGGKVPLRPRRFLVAKMLAARTTARLLVAPTGFGKSCLAAQYASSVFSFWHVFWLDCQDLRFLRALGEGTLEQLICQRDEEVALVVFDDVPVLDETLSTAFAACVENLLARNCEVIACSTPVCAESFSEQGNWNVVATHKTLRVQSSEQDECYSSLGAQEKVAGAREAYLARIPALTWNKSEGAFQIVRGFAFDELPVEDVLAGLFLFCVGSFRGARSAEDVRCAEGEESDELAAISAADPAYALAALSATLMQLAQRYPYFCFDDQTLTFTTLNCDDALFSSVLLPLVFETASFLDDAQARKCTRFLCDFLVAVGQPKRACLAARTLLASSDRKEFAACYALPLALSSCDDECHLLVQSLKAGNSRDADALAACAVLACVLEGQPCESDELWHYLANHQLSLAARCIYAALALRAGGVRDKQLLDALYEQAKMEAAFPNGDEEVQLDLPSELRVGSQGERTQYAVRLFCFAYAAAYANDFPSQEVLWREICALRDEVHALLEGETEGGVACSIRQIKFDACLNAALICLFWFVQDFATCIDAEQKQALFKVFEHAAALDLPSKTHSMCAHAQRLLSIEVTANQGAKAGGGTKTNRIVVAEGAADSEGAEVGARRGVSAYDYQVVPIPHLQVNLWGSFSVQVGDRVMDARGFKRKKSLMLLAVLALGCGSDFSRDYLIEALWPDQTLSCARRSLYAVWSDLRQTLRLADGSCPYLVRSGLSYRLDASLVECDVQRADVLCRCLRNPDSSQEQLEQAFYEVTSHFAGEMLPGISVNERIEHYGSALQTGVADALVVAARALFERGEVETSARFAQAVLSRAPSREDACALAMEAQLSMGQRASAIATFLSCQRFLSEELGVDPAPAVCAIYEQAIGVC